MFPFVGGRLSHNNPKEGREFIERPSRYKCPIENILLKLKIKAEH